MISHRNIDAAIALLVDVRAPARLWAADGKQTVYNSAVCAGWDEPCPDCTDGKIPIARLLAVGAAVFGTAYDDDVPNEIAYLRSVQP